MYTAIDAKGGRHGGGLQYCLYFVLLTLCGDYTLLNVFLAIACDSLDQAAALTEAEEAEKVIYLEDECYSCTKIFTNILINLEISTIILHIILGTTKRSSRKLAQEGPESTGGRRED